VVYDKWEEAAQRMPGGPETNLDRIRAYSQKIRRNPEAIDYALLADALRAEGLTSDARLVCEQGLALFPHYVTTRVVLAQICEDDGNFERAEQELRAAVAHEPQNLVTRAHLGRVLIRRGNMEEAIEHLEYVLFLRPGDQQARRLLSMARGQRPTDWEEERPAAAAPAPAATPAGPQPAAPAAAVPAGPAASGPPRPTPEQVALAISLFQETEGVDGAMLLDTQGLVTASTMGPSTAEDAFAALVHETWQKASRYVEGLNLGRLRRGTIDGPEGRMILAESGVGTIALCTRLDARLGLVQLQFDRANAVLAGR